MEDNLEISLQLCEKAYLEIEAMRHVPFVSNHRLAVTALELSANMTAIERILRSSIMADNFPAHRIPEQHRDFFINTLRPNMAELKGLFFEVLHFDRECDDEINTDHLDVLPMTTINTSEKDDGYIEYTGNSDIHSLIRNALDFYQEENMAWGETSDETKDSTYEFIDAEMFQPDRWMENIRLLHAIASTVGTEKIPGHVRLRLKEIYRSFIFQNWMAVKSLSRSLLEYVLIDRQNKLGIQVKEKDMAGNEVQIRVGRLVDQAVEKIPEMEPAMRMIVDEGNEVMHPRRKNITVIISSDNIARRCAYESINRIRCVIEALY